jgi:hypothetical protein
LGHAMLTLPLEQADDWAWLIDHSVQIGQEKCLLIVGLRLRDLPAGECLQHQQLHLIALVPRKSWTKQEVNDALEAATKRTGAPRVIVNDHGADLHGGVQIFRRHHARTVEIYDIKHKAACLLKQRLQKQPRWQEFQKQLGQTRCAVQQTELAFLTPPGTRTKARFMNLEPQLAWAQGVLDILQEPAAVQKWVTPERLRDKLGWLEDYRDAMAEWSHWQQIVNTSVALVNRQGIYRGIAKTLRQQLRRCPKQSAALAKDLVQFVATQARHAKPGERFPGSTEVLESCFGKLKQLEKQQARGGFTSLVISFGALLAETTSKVVKAALQHSNTKSVLDWCKQHLGTTLFAQRKLAFASATKPG